MTFADLKADDLFRFASGVPDGRWQVLHACNGRSTGGVAVYVDSRPAVLIGHRRAVWWQTEVETP